MVVWIMVLLENGCIRKWLYWKVSVLENDFIGKLLYSKWLYWKMVEYVL